MAGICGAIHRLLLLFLCLLSFVDLFFYADALSLIGFHPILTLSETLEACCQASIVAGILAQPTIDITHMVVHIGQSSGPACERALRWW